MAADAKDLYSKGYKACNLLVTAKKAYCSSTAIFSSYTCPTFAAGNKRLMCMSIRFDLGKVLFLVLLLTLTTMAALADNVKGQITDQQTGEPLPGATVQVEGTTVGAVADADGYYTLQLQRGTYNLTVSYIGYRQQLIKGVKVAGTSPSTSPSR